MIDEPPAPQIPSPGPAPPRPRRGWTVWASAAAAAVLIAGVATVLVQRGGRVPQEEPRLLLAAAAGAFRAADAPSVRFSIDGESSTSFTAPRTPVPEPTVTFDFGAACQNLEEPQRAECLQQAERMGRQAEDVQQELRRRGFDRSGTPFPRAFAIGYDGEGVAEGDRSRTTMRFRFQSPMTMEGSVEMITVEDRFYFRSSPDSPWIVMVGAGGIRYGNLTGLENFEQVLDLMTASDAEVEDLGTREMDGVTVRGFRVGRQNVTSEVWIGVSDRLLREATWRVEVDESGISQNSRTTIRFFDYGAEVGPIEEPEGAVPFGDVGPTQMPPFNFGARVNLDGSG